MNSTKIEWTDYTWNPVTGCMGPYRSGRCPYCYAHKLATGRLRSLYLANPHVAPGCPTRDPFAPRFWYDRLPEPGDLTTPSKIFTVSMGDLFDPSVPHEWQDIIMAVIRGYPLHTFQLLTKQPAQLLRIGTFPDNCWVGITATTSGMVQTAAEIFGQITATVKYLSIEPFTNTISYRHYGDANWLILGGLSGHPHYHPPTGDIADVLEDADKRGIPVYIKDNLQWPEVRREWPRERTA